MTKPADFWNERFARNDYVYGVEPNAFIRHASEKWLRSPTEVLDLAVGEGRNAVFLAERGHTVTAVDYSAEALKKTRRLAEESGVSLDTIQTDVRDWSPDRRWDAAIVTFLHLLPDERPALYSLLQRVLRPGGLLIAEWFRPEQRTEGYVSGGPPDPDMMVTVDELQSSFPTSGIELLERAEPTLNEGMHQGPAATVRFVWRAP